MSHSVVITSFSGKFRNEQDTDITYAQSNDIINLVTYHQRTFTRGERVRTKSGEDGFIISFEDPDTYCDFIQVKLDSTNETRAYEPEELIS